MNNLQNRKLGNAMRAYAIGLRGFKGVGFHKTQTARALIKRIKRWRARINDK